MAGQMLDVVDDRHRVTVLKRVAKERYRIDRFPLDEPGLCPYEPGNPGGVSRSAQVLDMDTMDGVGCEPVSGCEREPRLSHSTRAGERHTPRVPGVEVILDPKDIPIASNKRDERSPKSRSPHDRLASPCRCRAEHRGAGQS
jgi:hypothetical protein